ncbi:MAG: hypothetical protein ACRDO1_12995 [Nocardioidaceae bacterium]
MDKPQYDAPEPDEEKRSRAVTYLALGALVALILILIATGTVRIF